MKLPFWDQPKPQGGIEGPLRDEMLQELCARRQSCLLATPYLSFDTRMMELLPQELRVRATLSREAAKHALAQQPLKLRFPWGLTFYAGLTQVLGFEQGEQRRTLRLAIPELLAPDEQRGAYRLDRVGRSQGALGSLEGTILRISLENLSPLGAGVFCLESIPAQEFRTGRAVSLALSLEQGPSLTLDARICHGQGQYFGLKFDPLPDAENSLRLQEWMAPRVEEAKRRWDNRAELRARAEQAVRPRADPEGVLLLTRSEALAAEIREALAGLHPLRTSPPVMTLYKEALNPPPLLVLVDTAGADMEERYRLKSLVEGAPPGCPLVLLGRSGDQEPWQTLVSDLKAKLYHAWNPEQTPFFRRLVQGLVQRQGPQSGG